MNPADRNKILIIGGIAVVAIAIIVVVLMRGRKPAWQEGPAGGFSTDVAQAPGADEAGYPAAGPAAGAPAGPLQAAGPEVGAGAAEAEAPAAPIDVSVGVVKMGDGIDEASRPDSFRTFEPVIPPPPPEVVTPLPVAMLGPFRPAQPEETAVLGRRRAAGVMFNERAWAILQEGDKTFIVKPGDIVDGVRISAIGRDAIYVTDAEGRRWEVPLRGTGPSTEMRGPRTDYIEAMPELPPAAP